MNPYVFSVGSEDAVGLARAALERAHRLMRAQQAISSGIAEFGPPEELLPQALHAACEALDWSVGAAWLTSPDDESLHCAAVWHRATPALGEFAATTLDRKLVQGEGLPGHVLATGDPAWVECLADDPRMPSTLSAESAGLIGAAAFPLVLGQHVAGVIEFFTESPREPDLELLAWFASAGAQLAQYLDRWAAHETLLRRDQALAAAVNGVVIGDATKPGFPIVYANPGFERISGYSREEILGKKCSVLQGPDTHPQAIKELTDALAAQREHRGTLLNYRKDGTPFWNEITLSPVVDANGQLTQYVGVQNDVTERREAEEQVTYLAYHDSLTGLANRALLANAVERALERGAASELGVALLFLDLDNFKDINDTAGHAAGDLLLCLVAERLRGVVRASDLLARQGGDEFLILLTDIEGDARALASRLADKVASALREPFVIGAQEVRVRSSIGISACPHDATDAESLLRHADAAMYRAKRAGGGAFRFASTLRRAASARDEQSAAPVEPEAEDELERILSADAITSVFQPIVDLESRAVVGYEALARGPEGSALQRPDLLFNAARATGRLAELDWACRHAAVSGALRASLEPPLVLFLNVEPDALGVPCPARFVPAWNEAESGLRGMVEITERALTTQPAELLRSIEHIRAQGWGIALDDVGADTRSLALMPLLRPDVIKLDLRLVQEQPTEEIAEIVNAVWMQRERTGAVVLAEGVETEQHLETARAMGATLAQGWLFGHPAPLPSVLPEPGPPVGSAAGSFDLGGSTPYEVVSPMREVRRADKRLLLSISMHLEHQALSLSEGAVLLSAFQSAERFTPATHRRYTTLAADAAFVAALGVGMDAAPAPGVRGATIEDEDALLGEWSVVVVGPHFAAALVAVDLGDEGPEMERRFEYALTYERDLVLAAAASLMRRVLPVAERGGVPA